MHPHCAGLGRGHELAFSKEMCMGVVCVPTERKLSEVARGLPHLLFPLPGNPLVPERGRSARVSARSRDGAILQ